MKRLEKTILKEIFVSVNGLIPFTLHSRFSITPTQIFDFITKFKNLNLIEIKDERIVLTKDCKDQIINGEIKLSNTVRKYNNIPEKYVGPRIFINEFYIPLVNSIDTEILNNTEEVS